MLGRGRFRINEEATTTHRQRAATTTIVTGATADPGPGLIRTAGQDQGLITLGVDPDPEPEVTPVRVRGQERHGTKGITLGRVEGPGQDRGVGLTRPKKTKQNWVKI